MGNGVAYRYDAPNTEQAFDVILPSVGAESGRRIEKFARDSDRVDFGGSATATVHNAQATDGTNDVLGAFVTCEGYSELVFKVEYSAAGDPRRFRAVAKDFNATIGYLVLPTLYVPANTGILNAFLGTLGSSYVHGEAIVVSCLGYKAMTLIMLADGLTTPAAKVWGFAR